MRRFSTAAAIALAAALASPARAEVDVEVPATFKAKGTLGQPGEQDVYRFQALRGTVFTLAAAPAGKAALALGVTFLDGIGTPLEPVGGVLTTDGGRVSFKGFRFAESGEVRLVLSGEGTGDYSLSLKAKPQASWTTSVSMPGSPSYDLFQFPAYPGSTVTVLVKAAAGSAAVPRLQTLYNTSEDYSVDLSGAGKTTATSHAASQANVQPGDSELVQDFQNTGAAGGVDVLVKVKPPKAKPGKVDLRASVLGRPSGGETLVGRMVGASGGTVAVADGESDIFGAAVVLPADALGAPTLVSVASTADPAPGAADDQAAGPAVRLEPSGLVFPVPVEVTLPFDFTKIPVGSTPADIRIRIVEDNGETSEVVPTSVGANTVTIPTNGFSICIPIIESGPPNYGYTSLGTLKPGGDEFWLLQMAAEIIPAGGNDSRNRFVETSVGQVSIHGDGTIDFSLANHGFNWSNQDNPPMSGQPIQAGLTEYTSADGGTLNWAYDSTGTKIVLSGSPDSQPVFRVSRDGKYFAGAKEGATEPYADVQFGVRKNTKTLTTASLKGAWTVCFLELDGDQNGSTGAAGPKPARAYGTFTFDGAGKCAIAISQRNTQFNENTGAPSQPLESFSIAATYSIDGSGRIPVVVPPQDEEDTGTTLLLFPGDGLDVLFAGHDPPLGNAAMALVLVRQGTGLSRTDLAGRYHGANFAVDVTSYQVPSTPQWISDFSINVETLVGAFDGGAAADFTGNLHHSQRDSGTPDGTRNENEPEAFSVAVAVASQGKASLAADGKVVGQLSPDGQALILVSDTAGGNGDFGLIFLLRSPPVKNP